MNPGSRSKEWHPRTTLALARGFFALVCVSLKNRRNLWAILFLQLRESRRVLQFNTFRLATNQARFPKNLEMLRLRGPPPF